MVACDVYRPAAVKQLQVLGEQIQVPVYADEGNTNPVSIAAAALEHAKARGNDVVIVDTAGRLHIDDEMMEEIAALKEILAPDEILLVVDAMTGQEAVNVAKSFDERLELDGVILTKLDGDARGGAALSVKAVTGKPIKFTGVGEKTDALEPFHPDRMARRILGMGDVLTLIEKAEQAMDEQARQRMAERLLTAEFDLEDFLEQLRQVRNMGPIDQLLGMIPGLAGAKQLKGLQIDETELKRIEAVIQSMTPEERRHPEIINGSRRRRIAAGSGTRVQDVNRLLKQFEQTKRMMKQLGAFERRRRSGAKGRVVSAASSDHKFGGRHMAVRIRLRRMGAKKRPFYRLVVADSRAARDGRVIDWLGEYDPVAEPTHVRVDAEKAKEWLAKGAQPSDTARRVLRLAGVLDGASDEPAAE